MILGKALQVFFLALCLISERIEKSVMMFNHGFTYSGICCCSVAETLKEIDKLVTTQTNKGVTRQFKYGCNRF